MAAISYWCLSPTVLLALWGKLKGFDRTKPTPSFDWRSAQVDVVIPAHNEAPTIALTLHSLFQQDFPVRRVIVVDDGSTDATAAVVRRYSEMTGRQIALVVRKQSIGKTPTVRKECQASDADALVVLDGDTVLREPNYLSRLVEEMFRNAGVASTCGEVMPLARRRRVGLVKSDPLLAALVAEFGPQAGEQRSGLEAALEGVTVMYRTALYLFLHRVLYDGHLKLFGSRLSPAGCAVAYRTVRLRECFEYAGPLIGDNLSNSEDIYIGHFFTSRGYRNTQVPGVRCESLEPELPALPRQLYLWSSSFLQSQYYFKDLPLSIFRLVKGALTGKRGQPASQDAERRQIREQYRAPWGEQYTRRFGRRLGLLDLLSIFEKVTYPVILILLAIFSPRMALFTVALEASLCTLGTFVVADSGARFRSAAMMLASTPIRLVSLGVDLAAVLKYVLDLATGNRAWRK
jgi:glycosyltransferase involved in cell wall biosynthesis